MNFPRYCIASKQTNQINHFLNVISDYKLNCVTISPCFTICYLYTIELQITLIHNNG